MFHSNLTRILGAATLVATPLPAFDRPPTIELKALSSVAAITPGVSAAEIVAHDPATQRIFVVNVMTAGFEAFNHAVLDPSIRIFGPDKSPPAPAGAVALPERDIEPEYIAVSPDSMTAYVTCQENNAMAVVDIRSATVTKLIGLGFKDHGAGDPTAVFSFDSPSCPRSAPPSADRRSPSAGSPVCTTKASTAGPAARCS